MNKVELEIQQRMPFADGHSFGDSGPYERLIGRAHFAVDPNATAQAGIVDIDKAPVNNIGLVEYSTDVFILQPVEKKRTNQRLFFDYGNRGNKRALQFFNDAPATNAPQTLADAGNGFLMRRGYTIVWGAWQGDLLPGDGRMLLDLPTASDNGKPLTGLVRTEFIADQAGITTYPLSGRASTRSHPTISLKTDKASLTRRRYADDERFPISPDQWCFARIEGGAGLDNQGAETALIPSDTHIHIPTGFEPGWIYELVYTGRDPLVLGLGHIVVRDLISFLKYEGEDYSHIDKAYAWGRSQTGRCIRDSIYLGFNADAQGRRVFDGVMPHVSGAGRMWLNYRFANAVVPAGQQYEDHYNRADHFPFSYAECTDHLSGKTDAILKRPNTDPLVLHTQTATEYWQRRGSLVHTDTRGNDLEQPDNVRVYLWSSSQHFAAPKLTQPVRGICQNYCNVVATSMLFRAMLDALDDWATNAKKPPPSRIPTHAEGTLIDMSDWRKQFPPIPGVMLPSKPNDLPLLDFGADAEQGVLDKEPPETLSAEGYTILVPAVDSDGNDIAGVRAPMVAAPLGTYTGWNLRGRGFGHGAMHEFTGSYIPLPESAQERQISNDPRPSILERYGNLNGYQQAIKAAAEQLVAAGLMLEEDIRRVVADAANWNKPRHDVKLSVSDNDSL